MRATAFGAVFGCRHGDLSLTYQVVEFQGFSQIGIPDESMILYSDILETLGNRFQLSFTCLKHIAPSEDAGVRLHDPLHREADLGGSIFA